MERLKVLAVDDEPAILRIIEDSLSEKFQVIPLTNAQDAIASILDERPSLILIDNIMPGMSGLEAVKTLRRSQSGQRIPIIMLTALKESANRIEAFKAGVDDFVSKPFRPEELLARVVSKIERFQSFQGTPQTLLQLGNLRIDDNTREVLVADQPQHLTNIELTILKN